MVRLAMMHAGEPLDFFTFWTMESQFPIETHVVGDLLVQSADIDWPLEMFTILVIFERLNAFDEAAVFYFDICRLKGTHENLRTNTRKLCRDAETFQRFKDRVFDANRDPSDIYKSIPTSIVYDLDCYP